ncbi:recombination directionality factor [Marinobacter shengliensis]
MIKGLAITPPVIGRISIGKVTEQNGTRLPKKDDQFTLTTQIQGRDGWLPHPLDGELREQGKKLRTLPIRLLFNDPDLNLRAEYSFFDRKTGRPVCMGDGQQCKRLTQEGVETLPCPGPNQCQFGKGGLCKPYGRLNVHIGDDDELGTFIFRTTGFNSIRTLAARLAYLSALSGNLLACLPLAMRLRGKSTTQSYRMPIYYADITTRDGMSLEEAIKEAQTLDDRRRSMGFDQEALDASAKQGFANGLFEDDEEDLVEIAEEYFPEADANEPGVNKVSNSKLKQTLASI